MEHDHQSPKAEDKAAGPQLRKKSAAPVSSSARAVFDLQRAAGNRAVAKMLTTPTSRTKVQRNPTGAVDNGAVAPITVQRQDFEAALQQAVADADVSKFEMKAFAQNLVKLAGDPSKATTGGTTKGLGGLKSSKALTQKEIADKTAELDKASSPEERKKRRELRAKQDVVEAREERMANEDKLVQLKKKVGTPMTDQDQKKIDKMSDEELQDEVDDLDQQVKDQDARRKYMRKLHTKPMAAQDVKSLRKLL